MKKKFYCEKSNDAGFIGGKVYQLSEDGRIIDKDGIPRPVLTKKGTIPIRTLEDIRDYKDGNWSWIGKFKEA